METSNNTSAIVEEVNDVSILKPKKFALPKKYMRDLRLNVDESLINELDIEQPLLDVEYKINGNEVQHEPIQENVIENNDREDELTETDTKSKPKKQKPKTVIKATEKTSNEVKKPRKPSAYNIFMKDTLEQLGHTHKHMPYKERFIYATQLWNAHKAQSSV